MDTNSKTIRVIPEGTSTSLQEADIEVKLSEAASTSEYIVIRKLTALINLLEAERPIEDASGMSGETKYTPCLVSERTLDIIENKIIELVKSL